MLIGSSLPSWRRNGGRSRRQDFICVLTDHGAIVHRGTCDCLTPIGLYQIRKVSQVRSIVPGAQPSRAVYTRSTWSLHRLAKYRRHLRPSIAGTLHSLPSTASETLALGHGVQVH
jgi:hypothetical protein